MRAILIIILFSFSLANLSARELYAVTQGWQFFDSSKQSADGAKYVNLPHSYGADEAQQGIYFKRIYAPREWSDQRVFVRFYGAQRSASLFVNAQYVGEHKGGATAFTFEVTKLLKLEENNTIFVRTNLAEQSDILPTSVEHDIRGGLYRDVEIIVTPQSAISPLYYSSDGVFVTTLEVSPQLAKGFVRVHLLSCDEEAEVSVSFSELSGGEIFATTADYIPTAQGYIDIPFEIKRPKLWSPTTPNLYSVTATLTTSTSKDSVTVRTGLRTIDTESKRALRINSQAVPVRGVALYHDHPMAGGALTPKEYAQDMSLVCEMGATAIRSAVYPHDRALYDLCDEKGILVWVDSPLHKTQFLSDVAYYPTADFESNGREQLREIIAQNYNHPSIVMWGLFSTLVPRGSDFVPYLRELDSIVRCEDLTRPTVALSNQNGEHNMVPDLMVWRQDIGWSRGSLSDIGVWRDMLHSQWGSISSAVSYGEAGDVDNQSLFSDGVKRKNDNGEWFPEGRQRKFHEEYSAALCSDSLFWGVWLNSMFDFKTSRRESGMNYSGVVSFNREERKDAFYLYKALWNKKQNILYIPNVRNTAVSTKRIDIEVYATDDSVAPTLQVRDRVYDTKRVAPSRFIAIGVEIDGRCEVVARQGKLTQRVVFEYNTPLAER